MLGLNKAVYTTSGGRNDWNVPVVFDPAHNSIYVSFPSSGLQKITLQDWNTLAVASNEKLMSSGPIYYALGADNMLYFATGADLYAFALNVTAEDWAVSYSQNENIYITVSAVNAGELEDFILTPCVMANGVRISGDALRLQMEEL